MRKTGTRMLRQWATAVALVASASLAQATLFDRGSGMIYDDVLHITWMQDAGRFVGSWDEANAWASSLVYGGFDDWRLPKAFTTEVGCDLAFGDPACYSEGVRPLASWSEIAHLFFGLGNISGDPYTWEIGSDGELHQRTGYGFLHQGPFTDVADLYWLSSAGDQPPGRAFYFPDGMEGVYEFLDRGLIAWAVRDGDVSAVPEPTSGVLLLVGLGVLVQSRRSGHAARRVITTSAS